MAKIINYLASALVAGALSLTSCFNPRFETVYTNIRVSPAFQIKCETLEEARKNPGLRQAYIDNLVSTSNKPKECEIIYDSNSEQTTGNEFAITQNLFDKQSCQFNGALIYVGKLSFEDRLLVESDEDIKYFLNHEYHHVLEGKNGIGKFSSQEIQKARKQGKLEISVITDAFELGALHNDLKSETIKRFKMSPMSLQHQKCAYSWTFRKLLGSIDNSSKLQQEFIFETLRNVQDIVPENNFLVTLLFFP